MHWTALWAGVALAGGGCGTEPKDSAAPLDQSCSPFPVPEDAPTENDIDIGGQGYICYLPSPEGVCVAVTGAEAAAVVADQGPAAAGCEEGVVVVDGQCPADLALGVCSFPDNGTSWTLYPCNVWDDIPDGEAGGCESSGGLWSPAE